MEKERLKQILIEQRIDFLKKKQGIEREKLKASVNVIQTMHFKALVIIDYKVDSITLHLERFYFEFALNLY